MAKKETVKMTITQALNELKLLDKRITKVIKQPKIGFKIGSTVQGKFDVEQAKADLASFNDLVERRAKIKMLINSSNITTQVKVGGAKMSVLEAIEYKATIAFKTYMLKSLGNQFASVSDSINYGNQDVKSRLDSQISSAFANATAKEVKDFSETFNKNNGYDFVDPINVEKLHAELDLEVDTFTNEVDYVLSASNATTTIEI